MNQLLMIDSTTIKKFGVSIMMNMKIWKLKIHENLKTLKIKTHQNAIRILSPNLMLMITAYIIIIFVFLNLSKF